MSSFRKTTPKHRKGRDECDYYSSYRGTLRVDFLKRCGYCDDPDILRNRSYVIDHFLPMKPDGWSHPVRSNKYTNLIYACSYCNGAKSNTWPTKDWKKSNDGTVGFVKPTLVKYEKMFRRLSDGTIEVNKGSVLGTYIYNNLNLGQPIHSMNWLLERYINNQKILEKKQKTAPSKEIADAINELLKLQALVLADIRNKYNA